jgi:hypothetical protein
MPELAGREPAADSGLERESAQLAVLLVRREPEPVVPPQACGPLARKRAQPEPKGMVRTVG